MKILAVADEECEALWDYYVPGRLKDYDLIISCGDLKPKYLEFLATMGRAPVLYVAGNHDTRYFHEPPEGCDCIDDHFVTFNGLRIVGLGGCRRYHPGRYQYTERQMRRRIRRLRFQLWRHRGVDIVVTHAPPYGVGDADDLAHWGFEALLELIDKYHPTYLLHGHVHMNYSHGNQREREYHGTRVINVGERYVLEVPEGVYKPRDYFQVKYKTRQRRHDDDE
ncbi:MAG: metallophosphoesterase family protein [Oscillospiraceae bacterium]|nr:metallophosphoesterase family protein [Oscillospiraceae bacterium]